MKPISRTRIANNGYQKPTTDQIAIAAFHLYVENGCRHGHDIDDWLRAEDLLTQELKSLAEVRVFEPNGESRMLEIHAAAETREYPLARVAKAQ